MPLQPQDQIRLRDELLDAFDRQEMVELAAKFGFSFKVELAVDALRTQAWDLVQLVVRRGQLPKLLDIATHDRPDKPDLWAIASHLQESTGLTFQLRQQLRQILPDGSVSEKEVRAFCAACWPPGIVGKKDFPDAFEAAIRLAGISPDLGSTPAHKFPVLPFVERIAFHWLDSDKAAAEALMAWSKSAAEHFQLPAVASDEIRRDARVDRPISKYLLIDVHPENDNYRLQAHLWIEGESKPLPVECDERPRPPAELSSAAGPVIKKVLNDHGECMVEFLAPLALLNHPFDTWNVAVNKFVSLPAGVLCPVVIRLYERVYDPAEMALELWKNKWSELEGIDQPAFHWIDDASDTPNNVYQSLIAPGGPQCVALGFPPSSSVLPDAVQAAIFAGAPVLVWIRDSSAPGAAIKAEIETVLKDVRGLASLPGLIRAYRSMQPRRAHAGDFTLFYDSPDRLPPPQRELGIETSIRGETP